MNSRIEAKERRVGLDIIKILGSLGVIGAHIFQNNSSSMNRILFCFSITWVVPTFFLINGFLILSKKTLDYGYVLRKEGKIILTVFLWNVLASIWKMYVQKTYHNPITGCLQNLFFQEGLFPVFWFMGALMLVYIITPILYRILNSRYWIIPLVVLASVCVVVDIVSLICFREINIVILGYIPQPFRLWFWLFYFYLGGCICRKSPKFTKKKIGVIVLLFITMINVLFQYHIGFSGKVELWPEFFYGNFFTIIQSTLIFMILQDCSIYQNKRILINIGQRISGVYILHMFFIAFIGKTYFFENIVVNSILVVGVFIFALIVTMMFERIPLVSKLVRFD